MFDLEGKKSINIQVMSQRRMEQEYLGLFYYQPYQDSTGDWEKKKKKKKVSST